MRETLWSKLTHPLVWPVDLGSPERLLDATAQKYNQDREVHYAVAQARTGLDAIEQRLVDGLMARRGAVLDVGCGAGREAIALARLGYTVTAIDHAAKMVDAAQRIARDEGLAIRALAMAAHDVTPALGRFDYVVTTASFYTLIPSRSLRIRTLRALSSVLAAGGSLFLDAPWQPPRSRRSPRAQLIDWTRRARRWIEGPRFASEPGDQLFGVVSPDSDPRTRIFRRVFARRAELEREFADAGLAGEPVVEQMWQLEPRTHACTH